MQKTENSSKEKTLNSFKEKTENGSRSKTEKSSKEKVYTTFDPSLIKPKSWYVAFILWLFGGFFGLHHFYLHRDRHAFVTWATLAGYFGFGWFIDLFRLSAYVKDYNEDVQYVENLIKLIKQHQRPPSTWYRRSGSVLVANVFGYLLQSAVPIEYFEEDSFILKLIYALILPFSVAVGVHLVGNIGRQQGDFRRTLLSSYLSVPVYLFMSRGVLINSLVCYFLFERYIVQWRRKKDRNTSLLKRIFYLTLASSVYLSLWSSWIWFNCKYTDKEGEIYKCRDLIKDFFDSPSWREMKQLLRDIKIYIQVYGVSSVIDEFYSLFSGKSEDSALETLGLGLNATSSEISSTYRKLSRIYHPDKQKTEEDKLKAENQFILIQNAYRLLLERGRVKRKLEH